MSAGAVEQTLGRGRVVGRQDDEAGHSLLEGQNLIGGPGELAPVTDTGKLAPFQQLRAVAEIADQQQR